MLTVSLIVSDFFDLINSFSATKSGASKLTDRIAVYLNIAGGQQCFNCRNFTELFLTSLRPQTINSVYDTINTDKVAFIKLIQMVF